jgi:hypothetical protein
MLLKQDSEKRKQEIIKRNNLKKKLNFLKNKNNNVKERLRLQLDLVIEMNTLRKQKPILKNGKKEKLLKMLKFKRKLQILKES